MSQIQEIIKQTDNPYVNMFLVEGKNRKGGDVHYTIASRVRDEKDLKIRSGENTADGVSIYALYGEARDKVVLVRQYRFSIGRFIYEFPAGLCEDGEDFHAAAVREMHEETGLVFEPLKADTMFETPRFTTIGMTDESVAMVYGYASGEPDMRFLEDTEEIRVVLADRAEAKRILREEWVAVQCAYQMAHFIHDEDPFAFLSC